MRFRNKTYFKNDYSCFDTLQCTIFHQHTVQTHNESQKLFSQILKKNIRRLFYQHKYDSLGAWIT